MKYPDEEELIQRNNKKTAKIEFTKKMLEDMKMENYITVQPKDELALIEHYRQMPNVKFEPGIDEFWKSQETQINNHKVTTEIDEYMSNFHECEKIKERIEEQNRDEQSVYNYDKQEKDARRQIKLAKERLKLSKKKYHLKKVKTDPFKEIFGILVPGVNDDYENLKEARRGITADKHSLKEAKLRYEQLQEARQKFEYKKAKLNAEKRIALSNMTNISYKLLAKQTKALKIDEQSKIISERYHKQYNVIDQFNAIKVFKDPAANEYLKNKNKELYDKIIKLQNSNPKFIVKLNGRIEIEGITNDLATLNKQMDELKKDMPANETKESISNKIDSFSIKETDTIDSVKNEMSTQNPSSEEYKQLQLKLKHLELEDLHKNALNDFENAKQKVIGNPSVSQNQLQQLNAKQKRIKIIEEELKNDPFTREMAKLNKIQSIINQYNKLKEDKELLNDQPSITDIVDINKSLENTNNSIPSAAQSVADTYKLILRNYTNKREKIEQKEKNNNKPEMTR